MNFRTLTILTCLSFGQIYSAASDSKGSDVRLPWLNQNEALQEFKTVISQLQERDREGKLSDAQTAWTKKGAIINRKTLYAFADKMIHLSGHSSTRATSETPLIKIDDIYRYISAYIRLNLLDNLEIERLFNEAETSAPSAATCAQPELILVDDIVRKKFTEYRQSIDTHMDLSYQDHVISLLEKIRIKANDIRKKSKHPTDHVFSEEQLCYCVNTTVQLDDLRLMQKMTQTWPFQWDRQTWDLWKRSRSESEVRADERLKKIFIEAKHGVAKELYNVGYHLQKLQRGEQTTLLLECLMRGPFPKVDID